MILTDFLESEPGLQWKYAKQCGVNHATIRLPETPNFKFDSIASWQELYNKYESYGLKPIVIEPMPNCMHDHIKLGDDKRDESIERVIAMLPIMARLDIRIICMNFMAYVGWYRTSSTICERGDAKVTGFNITDYKANDFFITEEQLWDNLTYFLKAVVPVAEKYEIKLSLHPDDPPVQKLGNVSRILTSLEKIERAINIVDSPNLGVTICQATYSAMGEDVYQVIRHFCSKDKVFFVHFRDIVGNKNCFHESFHDNGQTDMAKAICTYRDCGYNGPIRIDHVPTMAGEENTNPGYASVGRLFAIGYLKGLLDASNVNSI